MKERINKFEMLGFTYNVIYQDKVYHHDSSEWVFGKLSTSTRTIYISTKNSNNVDLSEDVIQNTVFHELIHAILEEGQYCNSSCDEPLVEWIAKNIRYLFE